jgi:hypothetical protein
LRRGVSGDGELAAAAWDHGSGSAMRMVMLPMQTRPPDADAERGVIRPDPCQPLFWWPRSGLRCDGLSSFPGFPAAAPFPSCRQHHAKQLTQGNRSLQSP